MDQSSKKAVNKTEDVMYLGRWVPKQGFRTFVYDKNGDQKLANTYSEYESMIATGLWFAVKPENKPPIKPKEVKKDGPVCANS